MIVPTVFFWAAAHGGVTNGGLRGVYPSWTSGEISPFRPFQESPNSTWEFQKAEENGRFPQISSDFLKRPSLKLPFVALRFLTRSGFT